MPIVEVRTHQVSAPLHTPFVTALRRATTLDTLVVEIVDSDGNRGFGEVATVWQVTGESMTGAEAMIAEVLSPRLHHRDPDDLVPLLREVRRAVYGNAGAKAAVDVALHDLVSKRLNVPLPRMLGGGGSRVHTDVTLAAGTAEHIAQAAVDRVADGFTTLKIKVGTDAAGDLARVRAVREAAGPEATIRLDANQGWTPREAVTVIRSIEDAELAVELVEQPVAGPDVDGMAWVRDRVGTPILADEAVFGIRDLVDVIRRQAADLVNVKLAKCGGLAVARTLLDLADAHGVGTSIGSMLEGPIGVGAAASLAAAYPTTVSCDLDAAWWMETSAVVGGIVYDGETIVLPDSPGLGVTGLA